MLVTVLFYATFFIELILKGVGGKSPGRLWAYVISILTRQISVAQIVIFTLFFHSH